MVRQVLLLVAVLALLLAPKAHAQQIEPTVIVLAPRSGAEITDLIVPFAVMRASGVIDVRIASTTTAPVAVLPGSARIVPQITMAEVDVHYPSGVAMVVVPASPRPSDPELIAWVRRQYDRGARVVSICDGALTLAAAGLLDGRRATAHWNALPGLRRRYPSVEWTSRARWIDDGRITTTSGVSAAVPASLHLVDLLAGEGAMQTAARAFSLPPPSDQHDGDTFTLRAQHVGVAAGNMLAFWRHEHITVAPSHGFDELAVAFSLDAWSRTWRSQASLSAPLDGVTSRFGLVMLGPARPRSAQVRATLRPAQADPLIAVLADIRTRYGAPTARFVALQLEHTEGLTL